MKIFKSFAAFFIAAFVCAPAHGQIKGRVETLVKSPTRIENGRSCATFKSGRIASFVSPQYPPNEKAARVGGTVRVDLRLNERGSFAEIVAVSGNSLLRDAATAAARGVKFAPTVCNNEPVAVAVVLFYNFVPHAPADVYFKPAKIEEFADVKNGSEFYEAILNLTENYRLAFGYADKKFYENAPLSRGDFAEFLRRTLDLLAERARNSGKIPREINLFFALNRQKLTALPKSKEISEKTAYYESLKTLLLTYDISLLGERQEFYGETVLTKREVVALWTRVFGADAVPVNFAATGTIDDERLMTRGEFALFLNESLDVLTYKTLP